MLQPTSRDRHGPRVQERIRRAMHPVPEASPTPGFCLGHQVGAERITLHVAAHGQQVLIFLDRKRLEPALVQGPCSRRVIVRMPALRVRHGQPAQVLGQVPVLKRPDHQMPVVGQDTIGQQAHRHEVLGLLEDALESRIIHRLVKDPSPRYSAVEHMVDIAPRGKAQASRHAATLRGGFAPVKKKDSRPLSLLYQEKRLPTPFSAPCSFSAPFLCSVCHFRSLISITIASSCPGSNFALDPQLFDCSNSRRHKSCSGLKNNAGSRCCRSHVPFNL